MISKVTESNKELINARIEEINKAFEKNGSATRISNLEEYYAHIVEIAELSTDFHNAPYKFFLMPLDEPMFEIDANKRSISVPSVFSKNGVGVHGDHMAEVLYFRIDRYFDYQDLFNVDNIIINWQFRPSNASRNAELTTYTSYALAPDDTYDPGHIVFGWVIGNFIDKNGNANYMTPGKGTLSFSVSFLKSENNKYKYLFSTQTASVNINDTIILEDPSELDSVRRPIFDRLSNSRYTPENIVPLVDPVFRSGFFDTEENVFLGLPKSANFVVNNDGTEADSLTLGAIGKVSDDGIINYNWSGTKFASGDTVSGTGAISYVPTLDKTPQSNITYYTFSEDDGYVQLENNEDIQAAIDAKNAYEAGNTFNVTESGDYMVTLQSVKTVDGNLVQSGNIQSCVCSVPLAAVPKVELSVAGLELNEDEIYDEEEASKWTFIDDEAPTVKASISIDESKIWNEAEQTGVRGVTENSEIGAIALKMTNAEGDAGKPTAAEITNMPANSFVRYNNEPIVVNSASANGEGTYKVYAINKRNHTYNVSDASNELKVSLVAPYLANINVDLINEDEESENIAIIRNNASVQAAGISLTEDSSRQFLITVNDDLSHVEELNFKVIEVVSKTDTTPLDDSIIEPNITSVENTNNQFMFTIDGDSGFFIIEGLTKYHGTQRRVMTEPFVLG